MSVILKANVLLFSSPCSFVLQFLFQQMGMVVCFVKIHIRPYMDDIFTLIRVSNCVNTPPPLNPQSLNTDHSAPLIFLWSQANSCEFFNCAQLCLPPSSLGVMCSGPLDKVFSHVTLQYTSFVVWYLTNKIKEAVVLGEWENPVFSMWIIFFLLISLLFVLKDTFSQRYSSDLLFQSHLIHS